MILTVNRPAPLHTNVPAERVVNDKDESVSWRYAEKARDYVMLVPGDNVLDDKVGKVVCDSPTFKTWAAAKGDDGKPWVEVTKR